MKLNWNCQKGGVGEYEYFLEPQIDTFRIGQVCPVLGELDPPDLVARGMLKSAKPGGRVGRRREERGRSNIYTSDVLNQLNVSVAVAE